MVLTLFRVDVINGTFEGVEKAINIIRVLCPSKMFCMLDAQDSKNFNNVDFCELTVAPASDACLRRVFSLHLVITDSAHLFLFRNK